MRNLYQRFSSLSGRSLRTVGTCISADFGECRIQYPGGSVVAVKGAGEVGTRYFVQDGKPASYTHLTLPTIPPVVTSGVASLLQKNTVN